MSLLPMRSLTRFFGVALCVALLGGCASVANPAGPEGDWVEKWLALPVSSGSELTVAVIDGGVLDHPTLDGRVVGGWEAESTAGGLRTSHATEMAGLVLGVSGADDTSITTGIRILDVRVLDSKGSGTQADIATGIRWAVANRADLLLMSMSISINDRGLEAAVAEAVAAGVTIVASTTNGFSESRSYPAEYPGVIGVTSVSSNLALAPLAGLRGADIAAPGEQVMAPSSGHGFRSISGTSVAAATAASVIAAYRGVRGLDESGVIAYAKDSGAKVASDRHSIPVLRCLKKEK